MNLYKFRSFDSKELNLDSLKNNYLFASTINNLNDPYELVIDTGMVKHELKLIQPLTKKDIDFDSNMNNLLSDLKLAKKSQGIFSMSKDWNNELLWSHYAESNSGFCIEYDSDILTNSIKHQKYLVKVKYTNFSPTLSFLKIYSRSDDKYLVQTLNGIKSKSWKYEKEYRIIFDYSDKFYYDPSSIKSITFGVNCSYDNILKIKNNLPNKDILLYKLVIPEKFFKLIRLPLSFFDK